MAPALTNGRIVGTRPPGWGGVHQGDVVVLTRRHAGRPNRYIKRVAALDGDTVTMQAGRLAVNGRSWDGRPPLPGARREMWHVPPGHVFVVGDNQDMSSDSRSWGQPFISLADLEGVLLRPPRGISLRLPRGIRLRRAASFLSGGRAQPVHVEQGHGSLGDVNQAPVGQPGQATAEGFRGGVQQ